MHAPGAAERCRDRRLDRFRRAVINEPRRDDVRDHAVLDQYNKQRIEHFGFIRGRQPAAQDERSHVGECDFADQILI